MQEIKKTSEEWQKICKLLIYDPDGWNRQNFDYSWKEEKITREEFEHRMYFSTCFFRDDIPEEQKMTSWGDDIWLDNYLKIFITKKKFESSNEPLLCYQWYHRYLPKFIWKNILKLKDPEPWTIETSIESLYKGEDNLIKD